MSETFTPCAGPFHARVLGRVTDDQEIPIVANAGGCPDAVIAVVGYDCPEKRLIGTALLFQAAPDLLDACKLAVSSCRCKGTGKYEGNCHLCGDSTFDHICEYKIYECDKTGCLAARAAIAKAAGGVA